jgi:hypothetical protein
MALTTPRGFSGGPMADIDYGQASAGSAWVETAGAFATAAVTGTRSITNAPGTAVAFGVRVTNDAAITQALAAPGSGGAWYLRALRFDWAAKTVTSVTIAGPTTGGTAIPTLMPTVLPGSNFNTTPGTTFDLPLAWVFVNSANTTVAIWDLRLVQTGGDNLAAVNLWAVTFAGMSGLMREGAQLSVMTHTMLSGGKHVRSTWQRTTTYWAPVGRIIIDDTALYGSAANEIQNQLHQDAGNSRADLIAVAAGGYPVPLGLGAHDEVRSDLSNVVWRFAAVTAGMVAWRPWDCPWFDYTFTDIENIGGTVQLSKMRIHSGIVELEWQMSVTAQGASQFKLGYMPKGFQRAFAAAALPRGRGLALYPNGNQVSLTADWNSATQGESVMTFGYIGTDGLGKAFTGTTPFNIQGGNVYLSFSWPAST